MCISSSYPDFCLDSAEMWIKSQEDEEGAEQWWAAQMDKRPGG